MEIPKQFDEVKALCRRLAARGTPDDDEAAGTLAAFIYRLMIAEPKAEALFAEGLKIGGDLDVVLADNVKLRAQLGENAVLLQRAKEHLDETDAKIAALDGKLQIATERLRAIGDGRAFKPDQHARAGLMEIEEGKA